MTCLRVAIVNHVSFTQFSGEAKNAVASEFGHPVYACTSILTGLRAAVIDVHLTHTARKAFSTLTVKANQSIKTDHMSAPAWFSHTIINVLITDLAREPSLQWQENPPSLLVQQLFTQG